MHNGCAQMILFAYAALIGPASVGVQSLPLQAVTSEVTIVAQVQIQRPDMMTALPESVRGARFVAGVVDAVAGGEAGNVERRHWGT